MHNRLFVKISRFWDVKAFGVSFLPVSPFVLRVITNLCHRLLRHPSSPSDPATVADPLRLPHVAHRTWSTANGPLHGHQISMSVLRLWSHKDGGSSQFDTRLPHAATIVLKRLYAAFISSAREGEPAWQVRPTTREESGKPAPRYPGPLPYSPLVVG